MSESSGQQRITAGTMETRNLESSLVLIERARDGDREALNSLAARYMPRLCRWATGRLPIWARDLADTQDLVQETVIQAFRRLEGFDVRGEGALQAYLRQALLNRIRTEIRRVGRRPDHAELQPDLKDDQPSAFELAVGRQTVERYEAALARLKDEDREAIVGRIEFGMTNQELAQALGKPSSNAARMTFERALVRLAREMA